jgi:hypothetical protein
VIGTEETVNGIVFVGLFLVGFIVTGVIASIFGSLAGAIVLMAWQGTLWFVKGWMRRSPLPINPEIERLRREDELRKRSSR